MDTSPRFHYYKAPQRIGSFLPTHSDRYIPTRHLDNTHLDLHTLYSPCFTDVNEALREELLRPYATLLSFGHPRPSSSTTSSPYTLRSLASIHARHATQRVVASTPYKVLNAEGLRDDFYLSLVDWSSRNIVAVAIQQSVYLWNATTTETTKLVEMEDPDNLICSVAWNRDGDRLAVGTQKGQITIGDVESECKTSDVIHPRQRISSLAFGSSLLASGSKEGLMGLHDPRVAATRLPFRAHTHELCGLRWSPDETQLASGGNDNKLMIWDQAALKTPLFVFDQHKAAVKAISWSPHQTHLLSSGGGTADRTIRFWNTQTGIPVETTPVVPTGSQVCNLLWSKNNNELVSTHGYAMNSIIVWHYPSMRQIAVLTGHHQQRILYLACSPDGQNIVTGAGDGTLRFWRIFPESTRTSCVSSLDLMGQHIR